MAVQRKCPNCGTWNGDEDYCVSCNTLLSPVIIEEKREEEREKRRYRPPTKFDLFIERWKNSKYWAMRILYKILYTIGMIFAGIAAFFAWLAAAPNG